MARRLAENSQVSVLLIEAGGSDSTPEVEMAAARPLNLGSVRDWGFTALPNPHLNGRAIPMSMGKVLGGGSSINVMLWARGHKTDWGFVKREVMPTALTPTAMDDFIRDGVTTIWHQSCTAKMGQDDMSVVDSRLKVYGVDRLRIADASVMPRVPLANTMTPSVIIGEQASRAIAHRHQF